MKQDTDEDLNDASAAALSRVAFLADLFRDMNAALTVARDAAGPADKAATTKQLNKINELQTMHLMILRAEEVFHEKFGNKRSDEGVDFDTVRDDIGRALDRIRAAAEAEGVSQELDS